MDFSRQNQLLCWTWGVAEYLVFATTGCSNQLEVTERSKSAAGAGGPTFRVLRRIVRLEPSEVSPMLWSAAFFFFVLFFNKL